MAVLAGFPQDPAVGNKFFELLFRPNFERFAAVTFVPAMLHFHTDCGRLLQRLSECAKQYPEWIDLRAVATTLIDIVNLRDIAACIPEIERKSPELYEALFHGHDLLEIVRTPTAAIELRYASDLKKVYGDKRVVVPVVAEYAASAAVRHALPAIDSDLTHAVVVLETAKLEKPDSFVLEGMSLKISDFLLPDKIWFRAERRDRYNQGSVTRISSAAAKMAYPIEFYDRGLSEKIEFPGRNSPDVSIDITSFFSDSILGKLESSYERYVALSVLAAINQRWHVSRKIVQYASKVSDDSAIPRHEAKYLGSIIGRHVALDKSGPYGGFFKGVATKVRLAAQGIRLLYEAIDIKARAAGQPSYKDPRFTRDLADQILQDISV